MKLIWLSHPESAVDPAVPVPDWGLFARGIARATAFALHWPFAEVALWSSREAKALDCAHIIGLPVGLLKGSAEVDCSSTCDLPRSVHEALARAEGWERAIDAQVRIRRAAGL